MDEDKPKVLENVVDIFKNYKVWILIIFLLISAVAINYDFSSEGVVINGVTPASPAEVSGITFDTQTSQRNLERIISIEGEQVNTPADYYNVVNNYRTTDNFLTIITSKNEQGYDINISDMGNQSLADYLGISVRDAPKSNIKLGIELEGGSRLILEPQSELNEEELDLLVNTLQSRLDVYGASGTKVNKLEDAFSNKQFVIVESISANKNDIFELIKRQGEFRAELANETVFTGENVIRVLTDPSHEMLQGCNQGASTYTCTYAFSIEIDSQGGDKFFEIAQDLSIQNGYLSEQITFILDDREITSLNVASSFKFQKITSPQITVSGSAMPTEEQAIESAKKEMEFLQAILSTQSLPTELEVVQSYSISSSLGSKLLENAIWLGLAAVLLVSAVVAFRYRRIEVGVGIVIALVTEIIIVFGAAAFLRLSIDLAAIGGLIAAIGTGVDDQIIITDEYFRKRKKHINSRKKVKAAMYIIMIAYLTTLAAMIPLYFAGLNILQGFAFMIIIGVTVGVFITRPAYGVILRMLTTSRKQRKEEDEED